jgi:hypothetical protein
LPPPFEKSVFINCPFDEEFSGILQAVAFCIIIHDLVPRLAPENSDNAEPRLTRIKDIIETSKFGVHDISRCKFEDGDEFARLNMPFELGLDHGAKSFGQGALQDKRVLVLERNKYDYQKALSDIAGWDIRAHAGEYEIAIAIVRAWLKSQLESDVFGKSEIIGKYSAFQEWYFEKEIAAGSTEDDIKEYPTSEMISAMLDWKSAGMPSSYN